MVKAIKNHVKNNSGDLYFQMLICLTLIIFVFAFAFNVITVMSQKTWVDDKLNDITRLVAVQGDTDTPEIKEIEEDIEERMGGDVSFVANYFNEEEKTVQLNEVVKVKYDNDAFPAINVMNVDIPIEIHLTKLAISEVYYKPTPT